MTIRALSTEDYNEYIGSSSGTLSNTQKEEQENSLKPSKIKPLSEEDYNKKYGSPVVVPQPVYQEDDPLPSDDLIQKVKEERPTEKLSIKDLETDPQIIEDILQYRQDRFGTEKDVGGKNIFFGNIIGSTQELTPENIVDDYLDHYLSLIHI